jgi:hypothetical protein
MAASTHDTPKSHPKRRPARQRPSASTLLLSEVIGAGLVSARQLASALSVPVPLLEAACAGDAVLPTMHQRGLALLVLEVGAEFPELLRLAHRLLSQTEAMLRMESGETACHSLAPVIWR